MSTQKPYTTVANTLLLCILFLGTCPTAQSGNQSSQPSGPKSAGWTTDVIGVSEMQLSADYWVDRTPEHDSVLKTSQEIFQLNKTLFATEDFMVDLQQFPQHLSAGEIRSKVLATSKPSSYDIYDDQGNVLDSAGYKVYTTNLGLDAIPVRTTVEFALVVKRADMRKYPTDARYFKTLDSKNLDRFQENGLFPGDVVAVLHQSQDREWLFVQSFNYAAWVRKQYLAIGERQTVLEYANPSRFLLITGDKVNTSFNPEIPEISELQLDMGVRVPLPGHSEGENSIHGQNPYTSHTIKLPVRDRDGGLEFRQALITRNKDVHIGYLPFTRENIIRQAFKFLGERYGWGHSNNARDCTGFVAEVYKTFGILMPRNSGQQGLSTQGENTRFSSASLLRDKQKGLESLDTGDLIYVPGHVLMFIGYVDGQPYVIHDVSEFGYIDENGEYYKGILNGVSVTPLLPLHASRESTYVEKMYNIKRIR